MVLAVAAVVTAAFFFSFWGRNAAGLGARDMGWALSLSFAVPLTLYASLACAAVALVGLLVALARDGARRTWLAALAVAALPVLFLALLDAR